MSAESAGLFLLSESQVDPMDLLGSEFAATPPITHGRSDDKSKGTIVVLNGSGMGSSTRLEAQNDERDVIRLARADRSLGPSRKASERCIGKCIR